MIGQGGAGRELNDIAVHSDRGFCLYNMRAICETITIIIVFGLLFIIMDQRLLRLLLFFKEYKLLQTQIRNNKRYLGLGKFPSSRSILKKLKTQTRKRSNHSKCPGDVGRHSE